MKLKDAGRWVVLSQATCGHKCSQRKANRLLASLENPTQSVE